MLWERLRNNQLGTHFRRQAPFGKYTLDFVSIKARLVVEVDGFQHTTRKGRAHDRRRDGFLGHNGFRTLRFSNDEVLSDIGRVIEAIRYSIHKELFASRNR